jgi:hypothetical protein
VPLLGGLVQMMSLPLLSLGFMVAAQVALLDGKVHPRQFIEPLQTDPCTTFGPDQAVCDLRRGGAAHPAAGRRWCPTAPGLACRH